MVIVRSGVGVNYREPPDEIGRVGISAFKANGGPHDCAILGIFIMFFLHFSTLCSYWRPVL